MAQTWSSEKESWYASSTLSRLTHCSFDLQCEMESWTAVEGAAACRDDISGSILLSLHSAVWLWCSSPIIPAIPIHKIISTTKARLLSVLFVLRLQTELQKRNTYIFTRECKSRRRESWVTLIIVAVVVRSSIMKRRHSFSPAGAISNYFRTHNNISLTHITHITKILSRTMLFFGLLIFVCINCYLLHRVQLWCRILMGAVDNGDEQFDNNNLSGASGMFHQLHGIYDCTCNDEGSCGGAGPANNSETVLCCCGIELEIV